jgi:hypothetical protein
MFVNRVAYCICYMLHVNCVVYFVIHTTWQALGALRSRHAPLPHTNTHTHTHTHTHTFYTIQLTYIDKRLIYLQDHRRSVLYAADTLYFYGEWPFDKQMTPLGASSPMHLQRIRWRASLLPQSLLLYIYIYTYIHTYIYIHVYIYIL